MKLFGPKSWSYYLHMIFKLLNYFILFIGILILFHLAMGIADYLGVENPFTKLTITSEDLSIQYPLISDSHLWLPLGGIVGYMKYTGMISFGFAIYFILTRLLGKIFLSLSNSSIFIASLSKDTRAISWLIFGICIERMITFFADHLSYPNAIFDAILLFLIGIMVWFLSKIFEEGNKIQQELDLTI